MNFPFKFEPNEVVVGIRNPMRRIRIMMRMIDQDSGEAFYYIELIGTSDPILDTAFNIEEKFMRVN